MVPFLAALQEYLDALEERFSSLDLHGLRVLLDCANGAACTAAPEIFRRLGADVLPVADRPDGRNINDGCGSTHVELLRETMRAGNHDVAFALDGDGDRVLAVDRHGMVVDGDELLALAAVHLRACGRLTGDGVAVTVMTNLGFHQAMEQAGIKVVTTEVGDRHVLQALRRHGFTLGGEQSGHIIDLTFAPSGDGIAAALLTLEALGGRDLADRDVMTKLPQRLISVPGRDRTVLSAAMADESVRAQIERESAALEGRGRVLVRPSGTEAVIRVMVEAPTRADADKVCTRLAGLIEQAMA